MSNNNFNDFFDEELKKQEETRQRQMSQQNQNPSGFGMQNNQYQQKQQMYRIVPQYSGNGQQKFVQKSSSAKKAFLAALIAVGMVVTYFLGYFTFMFTNPDLKFI